MKFTLDAAALERVFSLWNIPVPKTGLVLFALRGCTPPQSSIPPQSPTPPLSPPRRGGRNAGWNTFINLNVVPLDFAHMRCTIGIWDRKSGRIFAAPGSTVPHRDNILKAAARAGMMRGRGTNQLEPGYYTDLTKGEHLQGKPQGHAALRQTGYRFYRRAHRVKKNAPPYTTRDPLYFGNPYDNLHCAWNPDPAAAGFRSSGCVVVAGWPHCPRLPRLPDAKPDVITDAKSEANKNSGAWKIFHDLIYAAPQKTFPLLLLPASDVATVLSRPSTSSGTGSARLVYGSEGEAVKALQKKLAAKGFYKGRVNGKLGVGTYRALMKSLL